MNGFLEAGNIQMAEEYVKEHWSSQKYNKKKPTECMTAYGRFKDIMPNE